MEVGFVDYRFVNFSVDGLVEYPKKIRGAVYPVLLICVIKVIIRSVVGCNLMNLLAASSTCGHNNNNNVHLSCAHQRPEHSQDTY